ncbi:ATP-dependent Clp protease ATP-binding subunit [Candidatus Kuenenbacteria bacterium]|nr:ATP-dependent Clp protease ATP-binding subunit [Candidatus Kuenenbacteria bacterium]
MTENILNKFTNHYKKTIVRAFGLSVANKKKEIGVEEIFWGLIAEKGSLGGETLNKAGVRAGLETDAGEAKTEEWEKILSAKEEVGLSKVAKKIVVDSAAVAAKYQHNYIGTEHLLYSLIKANNEEVNKILDKYKVNNKNLLKSLESVLGSTAKFGEIAEAVNNLKEKLRQEEKNNKKKRETILDFFGTDLTIPVAQKNINPVIGREAEIKRVVQILSRRNKNNPILLGEPGVGKTAIVEGLAKKIMLGQVPDVLVDKKIYSLDMPLLVAGTSYRGEFEARVKQIVDEAKSDPNIILFIDEIHNIVGAGSSSGTMDAANILKPALARGEIHCIGATTFEDYKKHIEPDSALGRRLQKVMVGEPTAEEAIEIIKGIRPAYEKHHLLKISDEAIEEAVRLSERYLPNQFLPDKAIDLIDEAASKKRVERPSRGNRQKISLLKKELQRLGKEKDNLVKEEKYKEAIKIKGEEFELVNKIYQLETEEMNNKMKSNPKSLAGNIIKGDDIRELMAEATKINISDKKKMAGEIASLEDKLKAKIIGQEKVIKKIAGVIKRSAVGLAGDKRPLGSFVFAGASGVGKTYTAKVLAETLNPRGDGLIRLDMSEYGEKFNASKIIGAPAGYVGYDEGGVLTEKIKRNPYSVVLLDEIEKAHPDIFNLWLSILEDGQITDSKGRVINFRNTIIIMTTNIGLKKRSEQKRLGFGDEERMAERDNFKEALEEFLRPEFLNRIDQILIFENLGKKELAKIIELEMQAINEKLANKKLKIGWGKPVVDKLLKECEKRETGARAVRETLQKEIEEPLADKIIGGEKIKNKTIQITVQNNKIKLT